MKNKKRPILIVIGNNKNGGIAKHAAMLANGFSDAGNKVFIIVTKDNGNKYFFDLKENVHIVSIDDVDINTKQAKNNKKKIDIQLKILKLFSFLLPRKSKYGKLIRFSISKIRNSFVLRQMLNKYNNPVIITLGLEYAVDVFYATRGIICDIIYGTKTYAEGELWEQDEELVLHSIRKLSCVVSQTKYTSDYFKKLRVRNIQVIGNPLDVPTLAYTGERNNKIVNFCRISKEKRLDLLIKAFSVFHKEFPEYQIDIYGNIVIQQEEYNLRGLLDLIKSLDLTDCVKIHDARKDIHEVVKDSAMFIATSDFEGLSNSMIEAMALGLPCICTDCDGGGAREYIEDGINGLLIPKDDEEALVKAMKRFAEDRDFAEKCGRNAVAIRERLEINNIVSQWQNVIDKYCN